MIAYLGPNPFADTPVVVHDVHAAMFAGCDVQPTRRRLEASFPGWIDGCPDTAQLDPAHALALLAAHWARGLLNSVRGVIDDAGAMRKRQGRAWMWVGFHVPRLTGQAIELALAAIAEAAVADASLPSRSLAEKVGRLQLLCRREHPDYVARILMLAARRRGIPVQRAPARNRHWQFGWGCRSQVFFEASPVAESVGGWQLASDKTQTNRLLRGLGLPSTDQRLAETLEMAARHAHELGWPVVVKPTDQGQGRGVSVGVDSDERLAEAFAAVRHLSRRPVIVERVVAGFDHRLLVVRGTLVAASRREPATVVGDGEHSVARLIDALNRRRRSSPATARYLKPVTAEPAVLAHLATQGLGLDSVPTAGRAVPLRANANVSTGGTPTDVLAEVHADVRAMAESIAANTGLLAVGIDYLAPTLSRPWREVGGRVIEINKTPGLDLHVADGAFSEEELGALILGDEPGRIPVVVVVGAPDGQRRLLAAVDARRSELPPGTVVIGPDTVRIGDQTVELSADTVVERTACMLAHRQAAAALVALDPTQLARVGLPVDRCRLAVWLATASTPAADAALEIVRRCSEQWLPGTDADAAPATALVDRIVAALAGPAEMPRVHAPREGDSRRFEVSTLRQARHGDGPVLFALMRNERYLAPFFFAHYRALGVQTFMVFDDRSDDGTTDFLLAQDDCTVLRAGARCNERMPSGQTFHHHLRNAIPGALESGRWVLTVDADEFLFLPPGMQGLGELYGWLDRRGERCVMASMVDFHPRRLRDRHVAAALSPFEVCPYFDADRGFVRHPDGRIDKAAGGIRARLQRRLLERDPAAYDVIYQGRGYQMAALWKTPLIRTGSGVFLVNSHSVNVTPPLDIELALAHFKFGPDLDAKVAEALADRNYYLGSIEYRFLAEAIRRFDGDDLLGERSRRFDGARSLADAGFIVMPGEA